MDQSLFKYEIVAEDPKTHARAGILHTPHGDIETPIFMPVGTKANVKGIPTETVKDLGAQIVLANTYHLAMRPGADTVAELGGLHDFMNWHGPILTDGWNQGVLWVVIDAFMFPLARGDWIGVRFGRTDPHSASHFPARGKSWGWEAFAWLREARRAAFPQG